MRTLLVFSLLATAVIAGLVFIESGAPAPPETAPGTSLSTSVVPTQRSSTNRLNLPYSTAVRDSILLEFKEHLARQESRLRRTPLLTRSEKQAMRMSRNEHHLHAAGELGIEHNTPQGEAELLCLNEDTPFYVEYDCHARLTDDALASLDVLGQQFHNRLAAAGVPLVRYAISSAYRSPAYQARLRRINRNATRTTSSHEFGTTYDITYRRFYGVTPEAYDPQQFRLDPRLRGPEYEQLAKHLAKEQLRWSETMAERYASRYAALLGRTLIDLEEAGTLLVLREWRQPCYHITVARRFGGA